MTIEISLWSAVTLAALLLPNLLYVFFKPVNPEKAEPPKPFFGWLEQLGRMGCIASNTRALYVALGRGGTKG